MSEEMSPVIYAECRFVGVPEHLHVQVWFKDKKEINTLIDALIALRDSVDPKFNHIHLQQYGLSPASDATAAEVMFHRPGTSPDEFETEINQSTTAWLAAVRFRE